jgi:hypothetical protein
MKTKLIKLNENHYIIVDDSEIKEGDFDIEYCDIDKKWLKPEQVINEGWDRVSKANYCRKRGTNFKITYSTQPLEYWETKGNIPFVFHKIKPISLSEVEEAIYGYSVEKMAENYYNTLGALGTEYDKTTSINLIIWGFKAHQKLVKDKLFTVEDMINAYIQGTNAGACYESLVDYDSPDSEEAEEYSEREFNDFKQSLIPKTEWDVTFDEQGNIKLL